MVINSRALIRDTITHLEALTEILNVDGGSRTARVEEPRKDDHRRKEIGLSIRVLLSKLRSFSVVEDALEFPRGRVCEDCDD